MGGLLGPRPGIRLGNPVELHLRKNQKHEHSYVIARTKSVLMAAKLPVCLVKQNKKQTKQYYWYTFNID